MTVTLQTKHPVAACAVAAMAFAVGCTHTLTVKGESKDAKVIVDGTDIGVPGPDGTPVEVRRAPGPIPYEVHGADGGVGFGAIERTETVWWLVALGAGGAACCAPSLAAGGFLIANPAIFGAPLAFLLSGDVGTLTRSFSSPSWLTIPVVGLCGTAGLGPLAVVFFAEEPPETVTVIAPAPKDAPPAPVAMRF